MISSLLQKFKGWGEGGGWWGAIPPCPLPQYANDILQVIFKFMASMANSSHIASPLFMHQ